MGSRDLLSTSRQLHNCRKLLATPLYDVWRIIRCRYFVPYFRTWLTTKAAAYKYPTNAATCRSMNKAPMSIGKYMAENGKTNAGRYNSRPGDARCRRTRRLAKPRKAVRASGCRKQRSGIFLSYQGRVGATLSCSSCCYWCCITVCQHMYRPPAPPPCHLARQTAALITNTDAPRMFMSRFITNQTAQRVIRQNNTRTTYRHFLAFPYRLIHCQFNASNTSSETLISITVMVEFPRRRTIG